MKEVQTDKPVAVSIKPVLKLVAASARQDKQASLQASMEIARELQALGKEDLAIFILAQFDLVSTFSPGGE